MQVHCCARLILLCQTEIDAAVVAGDGGYALRQKGEETTCVVSG
jgi:hypothetical protein